MYKAISLTSFFLPFSHLLNTHIYNLSLGIEKNLNRYKLLIIRWMKMKRGGKLDPTEMAVCRKRRKNAAKLASFLKP